MCGREFGLIVALMVVGLISVWVLLPEYRRMNDKQQELKQLQEDLQIQKAELESLQEENRALENGNIQRIIGVARDTYGLCFPGEKIYHFPSKTDIAESSVTIE